MLIINPAKVYISSANVDMRKSIDGLSSIVEQKFKLSSMSDAVFVFHNRHCDKIKRLYWDGDGLQRSLQQPLIETKRTERKSLVLF